MRRCFAILPLAVLLCCGTSAPADSGSTAVPAPAPAPALDAGTVTAPPPEVDAGTIAQPAPDAGPGWSIAYREDFENLPAPAATWQADTHPDDGPFSDDGTYFQAKGIAAPAAFRATVPFGASNWLTAESYTREAGAAFADRFAVVVDPAHPSNHALRIASPDHTDATVVRPSQALPAKYRVSLRVGFANFGDGLAGGLNGYRGGETAGPWLTGSATGQNGFYWLTILDSQPRPHNNVWIHHHRKVVMDSDNNVPPWMEMWNGSAFVPDGERPLMMIALDGTQPSQDLTGPPFLSYSQGQWQPSGAVRAVDQYLPGEWYDASIERDGTQFTLTVSGKFQSGVKTYSATIDAKAKCVWHYNRNAEEASPACTNNGSSGAAGASGAYWPADGSWPDWFMFGDPHENFYEGSVLYDDITLETWHD
jgi:hypothetical protein